MKYIAKGALGALLLGSVAFVASAPASAGVSVGVSVGIPGVSIGVDADCDDYYEPPWGYPADYCNYDLWDQPVFYEGVWYSGPFYVDYDEDDVPMYWIDGEWVYDEWDGPRPAVWAWGSPGFVLWAGRSHFGRHVWAFGGHGNWVFRHRNHPHFGGGGGHGGGHGGHGHGHGGHDHHGHGHDDHPTISDMRLKRDIVRIGQLSDGIGIYRFRYLWSDQVYVGVMAQEVVKVVPEAIVLRADGYMTVNYGRLGFAMQTWEEWTRSHPSRAFVAPAAMVRSVHGFQSAGAQ